MITGWAGTGLTDTAIDMPLPERRLYYRAGGFPMVRIIRNSVAFPTRKIVERQLILEREGVDIQADFGWQIVFIRADAYGAAIDEFNPDDALPLEVEHCPDTMNDIPEEADIAPAYTNEAGRQAFIFSVEGACGVLVTTEEPT